MIIFEKNAYLKLKYFAKHAKDEISGLSQISIVNSSFISIEDFEIFPQLSSSCSTVLNEEALAKFLYQKTIEHKDVSKYNCWIHSHGHMEPFWSMIDNNTIETTTSNSYLVSLVINKKMEILARLDIFKPFRFTVPLEVRIPKVRNNKKLEEYCINEIKKCVKENKISTYKLRKKLKKNKMIEDIERTIQELKTPQIAFSSKNKYNINLVKQYVEKR